jgi:hypothetical protein
VEIGRNDWAAPEPVTGWILLENAGRFCVAGVDLDAISAKEALQNRPAVCMI